MNQHDHLTLLSETQDRNAINLLETRQVMFLFILELNKKVTTPFFPHHSVVIRCDQFAKEMIY